MTKTIAVLGASTERRKFGNKCVRAYAAAGWDVYPVNPGGADEVEGHKVYRTLADIPVELDRISVYLPPAIGIKELDAVAAKGTRELWLNPGAADAALLRRAADLGIRAIPACSIVDVGLSPAQFP